MRFVATLPQVFELFHCICFRSCRTLEVFRSLVIVWSFVNDESIRWIVGWCPFVNSVIWSVAVVGVLFVSLYWFINYVFIHRLPVLLTGLNFFIIIDLFEKSDQSVPPAREYLNFRHAFSRFFVRFIIIIIPVIFFSVSFSSVFFFFLYFFALGGKWNRPVYVSLEDKKKIQNKTNSINNDEIFPSSFGVVLAI